MKHVTSTKALASSPLVHSAPRRLAYGVSGQALRLRRLRQVLWSPIHLLNMRWGCVRVLHCDCQSILLSNNSDVSVSSEGTCDQAAASLMF